MKAKIAAIAVILFLTASFFAIGFSALGEAGTSTASVERPVTDDEENAAVKAFKYI